MTFGVLKTFEWYNFYSYLTGGKTKELRYIAGLVKKAQGSPYIVKRGDNSIIEECKLFYNIQNIIECCLNVCDLRFSLIESKIKLVTSEDDGFHDVTLDLDAILDELSLRIAVSPKIICSKLKKYLTMTIRTAGSYAIEQATFDHGGLTPSDRKTTGSLQKITIKGKEFFEPYMRADAMVESEVEGKRETAKYKTVRLQHLIDTYMKTSLVRTDPASFVRVGAFLHKIMALSGFGRALNYSSSPRSADPLPTDIHNVAGETRNILMDLDRGAIRKGLHPPVGGKWIPTCVASWKSTSAGVAGVKARVIVNGIEKHVRISKKTAVGAYLGPKAFGRKMLSERTSRMSPNSVGFRDVPYKATRAIYVIPLPTLCAQIETVSHIVDYASSRGKNNSLISKEIDPSHFATGSGSASGVRVFDTIDTIRASGDKSILAIGTDLSSFDAHCIEWNFREPMIKALAITGAGRTYGPDSITQNEMLEYAFGKGIISESYWDNGREPIIYIEEENLPLFSHLAKYIHKEWIGERLRNYRVLPGAKVLAQGEYNLFDLDAAIDSDEIIPHSKLEIGVRMDGGDLVFLTSEASGEKSTLTMNTVHNLAMQRIALRELKKTRFGQKYTPMFQKGVGDDAEWIGSIGSIDSSDEINEAIVCITENL